MLLTSLVTRGTPKCQKCSLSSPLYTTLPNRAMVPGLHRPLPGLVSAEGNKSHFSTWHKDNENYNSLYGMHILNSNKTDLPQDKDHTQPVNLMFYFYSHSLRSDFQSSRLASILLSVNLPPQSFQTFYQVHITKAFLKPEWLIQL